MTNSFNVNKALANLYATKQVTEEAANKAVEEMMKILSDFERRGGDHHPYSDTVWRLRFVLERVVDRRYVYIGPTLRCNLNKNGEEEAESNYFEKDMKNTKACIRYLVTIGEYDAFKEYIICETLPKFLRFEKVESFDL